MSKKLLKKIEISGTITLKTGLHIGSTNSSMSIGGIDKGVIRNPVNNQPFIPGSSLKGKLRSLLEISLGHFDKGISEFGPAKSGPSAELFGNADKQNEQIPSRLIVRDAELLNPEALLEATEIPYTEGKTEVVLDRITSSATPRQLERVPAGAEFSLGMVLNIWEGEKEKELKNNLLKALRLLHDDYLGGHGSRGYGQVQIKIEKALEKSMDFYLGESQPKDVTGEFTI